MIDQLIKIFFGDTRKRNFKRVKPLIDKINEFDRQWMDLTDEQLREKTTEFRERLKGGETVDDLLPEAFAAVKQACRRLCGKEWEAGGIMQKWEMIPFDVQLCGGVYLHRGFVVEMATGEGKTLVATLPLYLNALAGKGAHLVTVNDYLAKRDSEWVGPIYQMLGMTVGCILIPMTPPERREAYSCDITYGTNNEFGFDYLRDNMAVHKDHLVQRGFHYAIVDEVDLVLIDEARTPLIISGPVDRSTHRFDQMKPMVYTLVQKQNTLVNNIVAESERLLAECEAEKNEEKRYQAGIRLLQARMGSPKHKRLLKVSGEAPIQRLIERVEADYMRDKRMPELEEALYFVVDEKSHTIDLTENGRQTISPDNPDLFLLRDIVEEFSAIEGRDDIDPETKEKLKEEAMTRHEVRSQELHDISQLLRAYVLFEKDVDYVIQDNKVIIVDEFTGRLMHGRQWSDGLHQAVEAKEGVEIKAETQTLATVTLQNFFRMYGKLAGMTGTAETEATEFSHTYNMNVAVIPTNKPVRRVDNNDLIYKTRREKYNAIIQEVIRLHNYGLPVLVGTTSVEVSETLSRLLRGARISHNVLNAKHIEREAQIVSQAGQRGSVTIATNMAGRGTDIKLGPGVLQCEGDGSYCRGCAHKAPPGAKIDPDKPVCGLQIVGSERHEARRIDRQLRGRSGRQGDPGSSLFFVSLEDDLMRLFASERIAGLMARGFEEGQAMSHGIATRAIASAQKKIEGINFEQRKRTLDYDNVMNKQREAIYGFRRRALMGEGDNADAVIDITAEALATEWGVFCAQTDETRWNVRGFLDWVRRAVPFVDLANLPEVHATNIEEFLDTILERCAAAYARKTEVMGEELMGALARFVLLQIVDSHWRDHLLAIDELHQGIGLRGYGQLDPLTEYQREATGLFEDMMNDIQKEIFEKIYRATIVQEQVGGPSRLTFVKEEGRQSVAEAVRSAHTAKAEGDGRAEAPPEPHRGVTVRRAQPKIGPNEPCPCGSGKKYKKCCGSPAARTRVTIPDAGGEG
ncbi:MAG: preprotein translocase subunit SecA [bacterium]|nr:preprotein translocase subunit SecA [bacterium]